LPRPLCLPAVLVGLLVLVVDAATTAAVALPPAVGTLLAVRGCESRLVAEMLLVRPLLVLLLALASAVAVVRASPTATACLLGGGRGCASRLVADLLLVRPLLAIMHSIVASVQASTPSTPPMLRFFGVDNEAMRVAWLDDCGRLAFASCLAACW
jgi:hypothetical protein